MRREGWRQRFDAASGPVVKGSGKSASGHGYNPYRSGGKFASGPHKEKPKGPGRAPGAAAAKPKRAKFNAEPHKQVIAAHKALETHHRGESLRLAGEMKALKEQAKATKPRSAERASLKEQHAALKAQRDEHKAKATASRKERIAASKEMQAARKEHAARSGAVGTPARKEAAAPKLEVKPAPQQTPTPVAQKTVGERFVAVKQHLALAGDARMDADIPTARQHLARAQAEHDAMVSSLHADVEHAKRNGGDVAKAQEALSTNRDETARRIAHETTYIEGQHTDTLLGRGPSPPEPGALKATEYRLMSEKFPNSLTSEQRLAIVDYSNHADHIINPLLRETRGRVPEGAMMYSGAHAPDYVHEERVWKRQNNRKELGMDKAPHGADERLKVNKEVANIDAAIASHRFDQDVKVYRALDDPGGALLGHVAPGSVFQDHGYVSTTANRNVLGSFSTGEHTVEMHITVRKGLPGAPMNHISMYPGESEVLLGRGSRFRVTHVVEATDRSARQVHAELLP